MPNLELVVLLQLLTTGSAFWLCLITLQSCSHVPALSPCQVTVVTTASGCQLMTSLWTMTWGNSEANPKLLAIGKDEKQGSLTLLVLT